MHAFLLKHKGLGGIILLALLLRSIPSPELYDGSGVNFTGTDPYFYMRNVLSAAEHFPDLPVFDSFQGFPDGSMVNISPLFVFLIAAVSWAAGFGSPGPHLIELTGAVMPVMIGVATTCLLYILARKYLSRTGALTSVFFIAVIPAHVFSTAFGNTDTGSLEPLLSVLCVLLTLKCIEEKPPLHAVMLGLFLSLSFLFWHGAVFFACLVWLFAVAGLIIARSEKEDSDGAVRVFAALLLHAGLLGVMWTTGWMGMRQSSPLMNNLALTAAAAASLLVLVLCRKIFLKRGLGRTAQGLGLAGILSVSAGIVLSVTPLGDSVSGMVRILLYQDAWLRSVAEMEPLLFSGGEFHFRRPVDLLTIFFFTAPAGIFLLMKEGAPERGRKTVFLVWTVVNFILAVLHARFAHLFALNLAVIFGFAFAFMVERRMKTAALIISAVVIASAYSSYAMLPRYSLFHTAPVTRDLFPALKWMRENTPGGEDYGVLARWDFGYWIAYRAERPVVANNSGAGVKTSAEYLITSDETELMHLLRLNRVRYLIVSDAARALPFMAEIAGKERTAFEFRQMPDGSVNLPPAYYQALSTRLFLNDGNSFSASGDGVHHLRLVYESENSFPVRGFSGDVKKVKVFEVVPGAVLLGRAARGSAVAATIRIISNQGREFEYRSRAVADDLGRFRLTVPYAADSGGFVKTGAYMVTYDNAVRKIAVSEDDIRTGGEVHVAN